MNSRIPLLLTILIIQLVICAMLFYGVGKSDAPASEGLIDLADTQPTEFILKGDEGAELSLFAKDGQWMMADGVPANQNKVEDVLQKLADIQLPWPVATTSSVHERFAVSANNYQRQLTLKADETVVAELMLGTSPGYRRVHARLADGDATYSIDFANHELPLQADDWLAKDLLAPEGELQRVTLQDGWSLSNTDAGWQLDSANTEQLPIDQDAVTNLLDRLKGISALGSGLVVDKDAQESDFRVMSITDSQGEYELTFSKATDDEDYRVSSSRVPGVYRVASYLVEQMLVDVTAFHSSGSTDEGEASDVEEAPALGPLLPQPQSARP